MKEQNFQGKGFFYSFKRSPRISKSWTHALLSLSVRMTNSALRQKEKQDKRISSENIRATNYMWIMYVGYCFH